LNDKIALQSCYLFLLLINRYYYVALSERNLKTQCNPRRCLGLMYFALSGRRWFHNGYVQCRFTGWKLCPSAVSS